MTILKDLNICDLFYSILYSYKKKLIGKLKEIEINAHCLIALDKRSCPKTAFFLSLLEGRSLSHSCHHTASCGGRTNSFFILPRSNLWAPGHIVWKRQGRVHVIVSLWTSLCGPVIDNSQSLEPWTYLREMGPPFYFRWSKSGKKSDSSVCSIILVAFRFLLVASFLFLNVAGKNSFWEFDRGFNNIYNYWLHELVVYTSVIVKYLCAQNMVRRFAKYVYRLSFTRDKLDWHRANLMQ